MKRSISVLIAACLLFALASLPAWAATPDPQISALSSILIDAESGKILWEKNGHQQLPMASTTKIMTSILGIENCSLDDKVMITSEVEAVGEEEAFLQAGDIRSVEELLYAMLLKSANDAAVAIAKHTAGSTNVFVDMMNSKAIEIGAVNTRFANPNGLTAPGHYSTAYDLALIGKYALENKTFAKICSTKYYKLGWHGDDFNGDIRNRNMLLFDYPDAIGIKTGYTKPAGYCLVGAAKKGDLTLISVILNAGSSDICFNESKSLLEYGYANFIRFPVIRKGESIDTVTIKDIDRKTMAVAANDLYALIPKDSKREIITKTELKQGLKTPLAKGTKVGQATVAIGDLNIGNVDLLASETIERPNIAGELLHFIQTVIGELFG